MSNYKKHTNGTLQLLDKVVTDYSNYWDVEGRSTIEEQRYNVHGFKSNGLTKAEAVLKHAVGKSILEIGCAPGSLLKLAKERGYTAEGIEPDKKYIDNISGYSGCKVHEGYFPMKFRRKFDTIIAMDVFEHVEDGQAFIDACRSLLTKDGVIIFMLPIIMNDGKFDDNMKMNEHVWLYSENHLTEWLNPLVIERWYLGHEIIVFK